MLIIARTTIVQAVVMNGYCNCNTRVVWVVSHHWLAITKTRKHPYIGCRIAAAYAANGTF